MGRKNLEWGGKTSNGEEKPRVGRKNLGPQILQTGHITHKIVSLIISVVATKRHIDKIERFNSAPNQSVVKNTCLLTVESIVGHRQVYHRTIWTPLQEPSHCPIELLVDLRFWANRLLPPHTAREKEGEDETHSKAHCQDLKGNVSLLCLLAHCCHV